MSSPFIGVSVVALVIGLWLAWSLRRSGRGLLIALALGVPAASAAGYAYLGNPSLKDLPLAERDEPAVLAERDRNNYRQLTGMLAEQMRERPDHLEGWQMLTRAYRNLEEWDFAIEAWQRAIRLKGEKVAAEDWAELAVMIVQRADGQVTPAAANVVARALKLDPSNPEGQHLKALARAQEGDLAGAIEGWERMLASAPPDADWRAPIAQYLAQAKAELAAPARGPSADDVAAAREMSAEDRDAMIQSMVAGLAARLEEQPDDPQGWLRLARAYGVLGRVGDAAEALDKAEQTAQAQLDSGQGDAAGNQAVLTAAGQMRLQLSQ